MAVDARGFGITLGIYVSVCAAVLLFFGIFRQSRLTRMYYAPKRYMKDLRVKPQPLPSSLYGWIPVLIRYTQEEVLVLAGIDATMFLKLLSFGAEMFFFITAWTLLVVLPTNLTGGEVDRVIKAGQSEQPTSYALTDLDKVTINNIGFGDTRLWVHFISVYIITFYTFKVLWRYSEEAVELHIKFLTSEPRGAQSHTVLVRDIPGVPYGTVLNRIENTAFRYLPARFKRRFHKGMEKGIRAANRGLDATFGVAAYSVLPPTSRDKGKGKEAQSYGDAGASSSEQARETTELLTHRSSSVGSEYGKSMSGSQRRPRVIHAGTLPPQEPLTELEAWPRAKQELAHKSLEQFVYDQYDYWFPGEVERVWVVYDVDAIQPLYEEYQRIRRQLEDLLDDYISRRRRGLPLKRKEITLIPIQFGTWGVERYGTAPTKVDPLDLWPARLRYLHNLIAHKCDTARKAYKPAAFVTFKHRATQVLASTALLHHDLRAWRTEEAPGPGDMVWKNLGWRKWERSIRFYFVWQVFFVLAFFYYIPVAAVQALIQINQIEQFPGVARIMNIPIVQSLVVAFLPSLVLRIFLALLPRLLRYMNYMQGLISEPQVEFATVHKYYVFQVMTVFLGSFIAGSLLNQLSTLLNNLSAAVSILGSAAPQTAAFFTEYILLNGFIIKPIQFLRLPGFIVFRTLMLLASTERAKARLWQEQYMPYASEVPDVSIAVLLGLTFCVVNPIIAPITLAYFLINTLIYKYQLLYVYVERWKSGGRVWRQVFEHIVVALIIFQLSMIGLLGLKGVAFQPALLTPLPVLTLIFRNAVRNNFRQPQKVLSLQAARDIDHRDEQLERIAPPEDETKYVAPICDVDNEGLQALLREAEAIQACLYGTACLVDPLGEDSAVISSDDDEEHEAQTHAEDPYGSSSESYAEASSTPERRGLRSPLLGSFTREVSLQRGDIV